MKFTKVEDTKMKIKDAIFVFFKCSLNKRAVTLILEHDEGNAFTFEFQSSGSKIKRVFEKENMISHFLFTK